MKINRNNVGIVLTVLYIFGVAAYSACQWQKIWGMPPNEFGDYLAGVFGPLAFLWLVLGYLQQGVELKQNTEALMLQAAELKNSAKQQQELVDVTKAQSDAERSRYDAERLQKIKLSQPRFNFEVHTNLESDADNFSYHIRSLNYGGDCQAAMIQSEDSWLEVVDEHEVTDLGRGDQLIFEVRFARDISEKLASICVMYRDMYWNFQTQTYNIYLIREGDDVNIHIESFQEMLDNSDFAVTLE